MLGVERGWGRGEFSGAAVSADGDRLELLLFH